MKPINCPHCFIKVWVHDDGVCPSCRKNVNETRSELRDLSPVEFVDGEKLPRVCVVCGMRSTFNVEVGELNSDDKLDKQGLVSRVLGALGGVIAIRLTPHAYKKKFKLSVDLPVCEQHGHAETLKPIYIDHSRHRITIAAHKDFIKQWRNA